MIASFGVITVAREALLRHIECTVAYRNANPIGTTFGTRHRAPRAFVYGDAADIERARNPLEQSLPVAKQAINNGERNAQHDKREDNPKTEYGQDDRD